MGNPICFFEIGCQNKESTKAFYAELFDWDIQATDHGTFITASGPEMPPIGGMINSLGHEPHQYTIFYVLVDDVAATAAKAESLGGKKIVGPIPVPNMGEFAWIADPEGNMIGLWREN
jgi:predicted enzyme related to lactoylglutathione lyase